MRTFTTLRILRLLTVLGTGLVVVGVAVSIPTGTTAALLQDSGAASFGIHAAAIGATCPPDPLPTAPVIEPTSIASLEPAEDAALLATPVPAAPCPEEPTPTPTPTPTTSPPPVLPTAPDQPTPTPDPTPTADPSPEPTTDAPPPSPGVTQVGGSNRVETAVAASTIVHQTADIVVLARADVYADALTGGPLAFASDAPLLLSAPDRLSAVTAAEIVRLGATRVIVLGGEDALSAQVAADVAAIGPVVDRIGGANRFATAGLIADRLGPSDRAYVAEGEHLDPQRGWPDALAAAPLAAFSGNPVLLVNRDRLPEETVAALQRVGVQEVVVVGGPAAVADAVVTGMEAFGPRRIYGADRYATAVAISREARLAGLGADSVMLATGTDWPDSLTAGPAAAALRSGFLLVDGTDLSHSPATAERLTELGADIETVYVVGGPAAIADSVVQQVLDALRGSA